MKMSLTRNFLQKVSIPKVGGEIIFKLASDFFYVTGDIPIGNLNTIFEENPSINALGLVDQDGFPLGLITRSSLFTQLSRPFGFDVLAKHPASEIVEKARTFQIQRNLYSVSEELKDDLANGCERYYLLVTHENRYAGIFTTKDMLIYLSHQTSRDITMARNLQAHIVKQMRVVDKEDYSVVMFSSMAKGVGGDFTYYEETKHGLFLAIADVSGKGITASLVTIALWGFFRMIKSIHSLSKMVKRLNEYLLTTFEAERYVTGVFCKLTDEARNLKFCDMGHGYTFLFRDNHLRKVKHIQENPPVGIMAKVEPDVSRLKLEAKDVVVLFTDGLVEQSNPQKKFYSIRRLEEILRKKLASGLEEVALAMQKDFHEYRGNQAQHDDVTICLLMINDNLSDGLS